VCLYCSIPILIDTITPQGEELGGLAISKLIFNLNHNYFFTDSRLAGNFSSINYKVCCCIIVENFASSRHGYADTTVTIRGVYNKFFNDYNIEREHLNII